MIFICGVSIAMIASICFPQGCCALEKSSWVMVYHSNSGVDMVDLWTGHQQSSISDPSANHWNLSEFLRASTNYRNPVVDSMGTLTINEAVIYVLNDKGSELQQYVFAPPSTYISVDKLTTFTTTNLQHRPDNVVRKRDELWLVQDKWIEEDFTLGVFGSLIALSTSGTTSLGQPDYLGCEAVNTGGYDNNFTVLNVYECTQWCIAKKANIFGIYTLLIPGPRYICLCNVVTTGNYVNADLCDQTCHGPYLPCGGATVAIENEVYMSLYNLSSVLADLTSGQNNNQITGYVDHGDTICLDDPLYITQIHADFQGKAFSYTVKYSVNLCLNANDLIYYGETMEGDGIVKQFSSNAYEAIEPTLIQCFMITTSPKQTPAEGVRMKLTYVTDDFILPPTLAVHLVWEVPETGLTTAAETTSAISATTTFTTTTSNTASANAMFTSSVATTARTTLVNASYSSTTASSTVSDNTEDTSSMATTTTAANTVSTTSVVTYSSLKTATVNASTMDTSLLTTTTTVTSSMNASVSSAAAGNTVRATGVSSSSTLKSGSTDTSTSTTASSVLNITEDAKTISTTVTTVITSTINSGVTTLIDTVENGSTTSILSTTTATTTDTTSSDTTALSTENTSAIRSLVSRSGSSSYMTVRQTTAASCDTLPTTSSSFAINTGNCTCFNVCGPIWRLTMQEVESRVKELEETLILPASNISRLTRRKICARDDRPSSKAIGALGLIILTMIAVFIVVMDTDHIARGVCTVKMALQSIWQTS